ncbi:hypothetical protein sos41_21830 [Alphaproteobacteria bacterium SO-S41]|nr:hypothetical protein sos41_21830 [Alphaproteobacteria bacterium SO-S41]
MSNGFMARIWRRRLSYAAAAAFGLVGVAEAASKSRMGPKGFGAAMAIMGLMGVALIIWGRFHKAKVEKVKTWPRASGKILSSGVRTETVRRRRSGSTIHYFDVRYAYAVQGTDYESDNFHVGTDNISAGDIPRVQAAYPAGAAVQVYYNPANPKESALEGGSGNQALFILGAIIAVIGFAVGGYFLTKG